jgi:hypothetical protein
VYPDDPRVLGRLTSSVTGRRAVSNLRACLELLSTTRHWCLTSRVVRVLVLPREFMARPLGRGRRSDCR